MQTGKRSSCSSSIGRRTSMCTARSATSLDKRRFFCSRIPTVNTLDPAWAARQVKDYGEPQKESVEILPLRELLDRHVPAGTAIRLFSIDVEGLDHEVVESNDWQRYRPDVVFIETHGM